MPRRTQREDLRLKRAKRNYLITLAALIALALVVLGMLDVGSFIGYKVITLSPGLPTVAELTKKQPEMTEVFDRNGLKIGEVGLVKHEHIDKADIPKMVVNAVVAAEDQRFFSHGGLDYYGIFRAGVKGLLSGRINQGGSTITQQVAKNYLLTRDKTVDRKVKEAVIAGRIEEKFSKMEIIELYLNIVNYGDGRYGIETACKYYFGHSIREASLGKIALLIGIHPSPEGYNPRKHLKAAQRRQKYVLERMLDEGMISESDKTTALAEQTTIVSDRDEDARTGQEAIDWVSSWLMELFHGNKQAISQLGWKIHLTVDIKLQAMAKRSLQNGAGKLHAEGAVVTMNSEREVLVMVGGPEYKPGGMNYALFAKRQPGSTFKGLVYAAAFESHRFSPNDVMLNKVTLYNDHGRNWTPDNYRGEAAEQPLFTIKNAFAHSLNTVAVRTICGLGVEAVVSEPIPIEYCRQNGLVNETMVLSEKVGIRWSEKEKAEKNPSLALGSHDVTPVGLLGAYMAIAKDGNFIAPKFILRIDGEGAPKLPERESIQVVSGQTISYMRSLTRAVVDEGTGRKASGKLPETAYGKTGTTNDSTNAWFVGGTDSYWGAVWVGHKNQARSLGKDATGASAALPIWIDALNAVYGRESNMVKAMRQQPKAGTVDEEAATDQQVAPATQSSETYAAPAAAGGVDDIPADDTID